MHEVLVQMGGLILCGVFWRLRHPLGLKADDVRQTITALVYVLLLPALVLQTLWQAPLGLDVAKVAIVAGSGVLAGMLAAHLIYRFSGTPKKIAGAMILASAFPNATYLGLPVLESTLGEWARSVAIQYDLFACTPLLLTVGMIIGRHYGSGANGENMLASLLKVPPLWAAVVAVALNSADVPMPSLLQNWLQMMGGAVVPLMLIALGMGLQWSSFRLHNLPTVAPVLIIQLLGMPLLVWGLAHILGLRGDLLTAVVLEAAMPCMVLGLVICDRYRLDTGLYASVVTLSTALSMVTLPFWFGLLRT